MAYWNAPAKLENHATYAVNSALEQLHELKNINEKMKNENIYEDTLIMCKRNNIEPIDIGIGINTGMATIGEMGSSQRSDYTVIGDSVNIASRIESLCKYYNSKCSISNFTKKQLNDDYIFRFLDLVKVKGKTEPVEIWQVHDYEKNDNFATLYSVSKKQIKYELKLYHEAISLYKESKFKEALEIFMDINDWCNKTNDNIYDIYIQRCAKYIIEPPEDFDGVFEHTTKG
jgi:adenylate cyclase